MAAVEVLGGQAGYARRTLLADGSDLKMQAQAGCMACAAARCDAMTMRESKWFDLQRAR